MKLGTIALLILSVSCGRYKVTGGNTASVGELRQMTTRQLAADEQESIGQICNALRIKSGTISSVSGATFTFDTAQTDCNGQSLGSGEVQTTIQNSGFGPTFKRKSDGQDFFFPTVETLTSGTFSELCSSLSTANGVQTNATQEVTFYRSTNIPQNECEPRIGEVCFYLEKGFDQLNGSVKIHTKEWIRVRTASTQGKIGFFTFRRKISQSYCPENQAQVLEATLK